MTKVDLRLLGIPFILSKESRKQWPLLNVNKVRLILDCFYVRQSSNLLYFNTVLVLFLREHAPSIIFMDEIDSIGSARMESGTGNGDSEVQRTMLELLNQLDGFEASNKIKVLLLLP